MWWQSILCAFGQREKCFRHYIWSQKIRVGTFWVFLDQKQRFAAIFVKSFSSGGKILNDGANELMQEFIISVWCILWCHALICLAFRLGYFLYKCFILGIYALSLFCKTSLIGSCHHSESYCAQMDKNSGTFSFSLSFVLFFYANAIKLNRMRMCSEPAELQVPLYRLVSMIINSTWSPAMQIKVHNLFCVRCWSVHVSSR